MKGGNEVTMLLVFVPISAFETVDFNAVIFKLLQPAVTMQGTSELLRRKDTITTVFTSGQ
jgi:hypothetical protein